MPARISKALADALCASREKQPSKATRSREGNKFGAVRTVFGSEVFDSRAELARWLELRILQRAGEISELERQVSYDLTVAGIRIGRIKPDFRYRRDGQVVVEEFKSPATKTRLWAWKAKHLLAEHGVKLEVSQ